MYGGLSVLGLRSAEAPFTPTLPHRTQRQKNSSQDGKVCIHSETYSTKGHHKPYMHDRASSIEHSNG